MRDLKFRAWKQSRKAFIEWQASGELNANQGTILDLYHSTYEGYELVIEQFVGTKDKNGADIFEGDILKHDRDGTIGEVEMFASCFGFASPTGFRTIWGNEVEVIGNIHENPELLK